MCLKKPCMSAYLSWAGNTATLSKIGASPQVDGALIRSLQQPGDCIDSGIPAPPPETTGRGLSVQDGMPATGWFRL